METSTTDEHHCENVTVLLMTDVLESLDALS